MPRILSAILTLALAQSSWQAAAGEYIDAYRSFFTVAGANTAEASSRLPMLAKRAQIAAPSAAELGAALSADKPRTVALATASLAVSEHPAPDLLDVLVRRFAREPDPILRRLSLDAMTRAERTWLEERGGDIARALAAEKEQGVATMAILSILPRLRRADALVAAVGLATNGGPAVRQILHASLVRRDGAPALRALAEELRRNGQAELASEAEAAARARSHAP